ncbi:MAG: site-specific integrase [Prevotellaceae bacterium]|jgi:integrase|nr:site-specific integrase [Prevotellaceae bacterium]
MNFRELASKWVEYKQMFVKRSSMSAYQLLIENHLLPRFGNEEEIPENAVQDFVLQKMKEGLSRKTAGDILIVLKMILKFGQKQNIFNYQTLDDIVFPAENVNKQLEVLTVAQTNTLIAYLRDNFTFRNLGILIAVSTGVRIGELCALQWSDVDMERGVLTVQKTIQRIYIIEGGRRRTEVIMDDPKTSSSNREVPLSPDLIKILKPLMKIVKSDNYLLTNDDKPTEPETFRIYYRKLMAKLGLPRMKFHGLRHSFATRCINANVDIKTVSVLLGHSNVSTTLNVYTHPDLEQKKSAIHKMFKTLK